MKRFNVAEYMKQMKEKNRKMCDGKDRMKEIDEELREIDECLVRKKREIELRRKEVKSKQEELRRLDKKVESVVRNVEELEGIERELVSSEPATTQSRSHEARVRNPTRYNDDGKTLHGSDRNIKRRRKETMDAAMAIHGGTSTTTLPAEIGLADTTMNRCSTGVITTSLSQHETKKKTIINKLYNSNVKEYEGSEDNIIRSVAVYYNGGGGVCGKKKYRKIYRDMSYSINRRKGTQTARITISSLPVPRLIPHKFMPIIRDIPIGTLHNIADELCQDMPEDQKVSGVYRDLKETLVALGQFYLSGYSGHELCWFGEPFTFQFCIGGDGAPFGKDESSCAWLVSFLNIGRGMLSSNENFLIFGANCSENCPAVIQYINILKNEINEIERNVFVLNHNGQQVSVKFRLGELPNDMKMTAFLSGELNNSAKYFSSFADVSIDNYAILDGTFGKGKKCTWKPWEYANRVKVAKEVEKLKKRQKKEKLAESTKRTKVTTYIAKQKSRQEFVPLMGDLIDRTHVEPLHLKNNACALVHGYLLKEVIQLNKAYSHVVSFSELKPDSPLFKYVETMKKQCGLSRLAKQVVRWFNTHRGCEKPFEYSFTGRDSRGLLHNFMYLIAALEPFVKKDSKNELLLHAAAHHCLVLRDCVSFFNRVDISDEEVSKLEKLCHEYHKVNVLYFAAHQTAWTLAHIVLSHTKDMKAKYGKGLGLNSMEGREAKHVFIF